MQRSECYQTDAAQIEWHRAGVPQPNAAERIHIHLAVEVGNVEQKGLFFPGTQLKNLQYPVINVCWSDILVHSPAFL